MTDGDATDPRHEELLAGAEAEAARDAGAEAHPKVVTPKARTSARSGSGSASNGSGPAAATTSRGSVPPRKRPARVSPPAGSASLPPEAPPLEAAEPRTDGRAAAARPVSGEVVTIRGGGADVVTATNVDVQRGGIGRARATDIAVSQGGVGVARADRVSVELGGIGAALGGEVSITQGGAGSIFAREARVEQSVVRTLVANTVHVERATGVGVLIARRVDGNVRAILDWRGALAFGAAFGVVSGLLRRARRR
jgi:hypothetical protein